LEVGWFLSLQNCTSLTSLPKGLKVGGGLNIYKTELTNYPNSKLKKMIQLGFIKGEIYR
jgi:hypothetical protein